MKQFSFDTSQVLSWVLSKSDDVLKNKFMTYREEVRNIDLSRCILYVSTTLTMKRRVQNMLHILSDIFSGCRIVCHSSAGNVFNFSYHSGVSLSLVYFEDDTSLFDIIQYDMKSTTQKNIAESIKKYVLDHPWVKGVEIYHTLYRSNISDFREVLNTLPEDVVIFGGMVCNEELLSNFSFVSNGWNNISESGILVVYIGGDNLFVDAKRVSGWKPVRRHFCVTKAEGNVIKRIDDKPAIDIYKKYLDINDDSKLFYNCMEFPMFCEYDNVLTIRDPLYTDDRGYLYMSDVVCEGTSICLSYADPSLISHDIMSVCGEISKFSPDVVNITSCVARNIFWNHDANVSELQPFKDICACHGYLSKGEFIREDGVFKQHNTVMIIVTLREGAPKNVSNRRVSFNDYKEIPLISRMGVFLSRVTEELEDSFATINSMNDKLEYIATTDSLTGIANRYMFDKQLTLCSDDIGHAETKYLIMFDVNGLKFVNDTYGHEEGDALIKSAANVIDSVFSVYGQCFRIGGDEFAAIVDFEDEDQLMSAYDLFYENIDKCNSNANYVLSIATGYSPMIGQFGDRKTVSDWKMDADINMYNDKSKFHASAVSYVSDGLSSFVLCIMSIIDNKDKYTAYHSVRVQKLSVSIGEHMGLPDDVMCQLSLAAYLHDIGKIGVSDTILFKSEKLSMEEFDIIQQAPVIGKKILMQADDTKDIADIVLHHHERYDGRGYPDGMKGDEIPICSRIICIADSIDAMLNRRHHREALSPDICYKELERNKGKMYDPMIVDVVLMNFVDILKSGISEHNSELLSI